MQWGELNSLELHIIPVFTNDFYFFFSHLQGCSCSAFHRRHLQALPGAQMHLAQQAGLVWSPICGWDHSHLWNGCPCPPVNEVVGDWWVGAVDTRKCSFDTYAVWLSDWLHLAALFFSRFDHPASMLIYPGTGNSARIVNKPYYLQGS